MIKHFSNLLYWHLVYLPRCKGLGMRNLQYQIRICQKSHNIVTNHNYILCVVQIFMKQTLKANLLDQNVYELEFELHI